jgi:hypothetical protein
MTDGVPQGQDEWLLAAGQGPGLSRVSGRCLRRWRSGRWSKARGQQGRGHQPDQADRAAQAGAEVGHAARHEAVQASWVTPPRASPWIPMGTGSPPRWRTWPTAWSEPEQLRS